MHQRQFKSFHFKWFILPDIIIIGMAEYTEARNGCTNNDSMKKDAEGKVKLFIFPSTIYRLFECDCTEYYRNIVEYMQELILDWRVINSDNIQDLQRVYYSLRRIMNLHGINLLAVENKFLEGLGKYGFLNFTKPIADVDLPQEYKGLEFIKELPRELQMVILLMDSASRHYLQAHQIIQSVTWNIIIDEELESMGDEQARVLHLSGIVTNLLMALYILEKYLKWK